VYLIAVPHIVGSTENAGPELGGPNKTKGRNLRVENGESILNTGKCRTGNCRTGKYRTGKRRTKKIAGGNFRTTVAHIIKQNTRIPDAQKLQIIQLCWEKNSAKALKVTMNILRKRSECLTGTGAYPSVWVPRRQDTHCPWQTPCSQRASKSVCVHNPVLRFPVLHFLALQTGPPFSAPPYCVGWRVKLLLTHSLICLSGCRHRFMRYIIQQIPWSAALCMNTQWLTIEHFTPKTLSVRNCEV